MARQNLLGVGGYEVRGRGESGEVGEEMARQSLLGVGGSEVREEGIRGSWGGDGQAEPTGSGRV